MTPNEAAVESYRASGKVDWGSFLPLATLVLLVATGLAYGLHFAFISGFYYVLEVPGLAAVILACFVLLAVWLGRCRSPVIGGFLGIVAGTVLYLGYYYFGMIHVLGPRAALKPQIFPRYIDLHMRTMEFGDERRRGGKQLGIGPNAEFIVLENKLFVINKTKNPTFNWVTFGFEIVLVLLITGGAGLVRARQPYCETCGRWKKQELAFLGRGQAKVVASAFRSGNLAEVADIPAVIIKFNSAYTAMAIEYCPAIDGQHSACPVYFSVKEVWRGGGLGQFQQFGVAMGRMRIRRMALTAEEIEALAGKFPSLAALETKGEAQGSEISGKEASPVASILSPPTRLSPATGFADIQPVEAPHDRKIMNKRTLIIGSALTLLPLLIFFGGIACAVLGAYWWIPPDKPPPNAPENVPLYATMIGVGALLAVVGGYWGLRNTTYLANRYLRSLARSEVRMRPDSIVDPDDPEAVFVEIVPRAHWGKMMLETATDVGWFLVDEARRELRFEGDRERYRIPAEAIVSCQVEQVVSGQGTSSQIVTYPTVIRVRRPSETLEVPVLYRGDMGSLGAKVRLKRAGEFCDKILSILPPLVASPVAPTDY